MSHSCLSIIYEDDALLVIDKPPWQLSVPGKNPDLVSAFQHACNYLGQSLYVVHRLDCATSGVMVFAKTPEAQRRLHKSFRNRCISKIYQAVLCSRPEKSNGTVELPLITDWPNRPRQKVDFSIGKAANTEWSITNQQLKRSIRDSIKIDKTACENFTAVYLRPLTGRTHQLRVHMQAIGHPILGDRLYAPLEFQSQPDIAGPVSRLHLHADTLYLQHPVGGRSVSFSAHGANSLFQL